MIRLQHPHVVRAYEFGLGDRGPDARWNAWKASEIGLGVMRQQIEVPLALPELARAVSGAPPTTEETTIVSDTATEVLYLNPRRAT